MDGEQKLEIKVSEPLDISKRVKEIIESSEDEKKSKPGRLLELMRDDNIKTAQEIKLILPWYSLEWTKWVKSWVQEARDNQPRQAAIICNASQYMEAANIFASGVDWIDSNGIQKP